jgi:hypothetical protein
MGWFLQSFLIARIGWAPVRGCTFIKSRRRMAVCRVACFARRRESGAVSFFGREQQAVSAVFMRISRRSGSSSRLPLRRLAALFAEE